MTELKNTERGSDFSEVTYKGLPKVFLNYWDIVDVQFTILKCYTPQMEYNYK